MLESNLGSSGGGVESSMKEKHNGLRLIAIEADL